MILLEAENKDLSKFLQIFYERFAEMNGITLKTAKEDRSLDDAIEQIRSGTHNYFGNYRNSRPAALLIERFEEADDFFNSPSSEIEWLVACPYSRGSGKELLKEYLKNKEAVRLDVSVKNHRAIRLYHDHGFEIKGTYGVQDPMHVMAVRF